MQRTGDDLFACAVFACDQDICVRWSDARHQLQYRLHGWSLCDERWTAVGAEQIVFGLEALFFSQASSKLHWSSNDAQEPRIFPWLLHEVTRPSPNRFNGEFDTPPGRHHDDRHHRIHGMNS